MAFYVDLTPWIQKNPFGVEFDAKGVELRVCGGLW